MQLQPSSSKFLYKKSTTFLLRSFLGDAFSRLSQPILPMDSHFGLFGVFSKSLWMSEGPRWPSSTFDFRIQWISPNFSKFIILKIIAFSHFHSLSACFQINAQPSKFQPLNPAPPRHAAHRSVFFRVAQGASALGLRTGLLGSLGFWWILEEKKPAEFHRKKRGETHMVDIYFLWFLGKSPFVIKRDCSNFKQEAKGCGGKLVDKGPCFKDFLPHKNEDPSTPPKARIPGNFYVWRSFLSQQQMVRWKLLGYPAVERPYKKRVWKLLKTQFLLQKSSRCVSHQKVKIDTPR